MRALLLAGVLALGWAGAAFAQTYTDTWSFIDLDGNTVAGTLSGIQNGTNLSADNLTATVTQTLYPELLQSYTVIAATKRLDGTGGEYSAVDGIVTFADFILVNHNILNYVWFGTGPGVNTYAPEVADVDLGRNQQDRTIPDTFMLAATTVPEPGSLALLGLPVGLLALVGMRRRQGAAAI